MDESFALTSIILSSSMRVVSLMLFYIGSIICIIFVSLIITDSFDVVTLGLIISIYSVIRTDWLLIVTWGSFITIVSVKLVMFIYKSTRGTSIVKLEEGWIKTSLVTVSLIISIVWFSNDAEPSVTIVVVVTVVVALLMFRGLLISTTVVWFD